MDERRVTRNLAAVLIVLTAWGLMFGSARAQSQIVSSQAVPLSDALLVLGIIAERDVMLLQIPREEVVLPQEVDDWSLLFDVLTGSHGLEWCLAGWNIVVGPVGKVCEHGTAGRPLVDEVVTNQLEAVAEAPESGAGAGAADSESHEAEDTRPLSLRLRVVQIDERLATELGINWRGGVFETASTLVAGGRFIAGGVFPPPAFDEVITFLETEGVAARLEDVTLATVGGEQVNFNRGGTINVTLARETSIERSYQYGLGLTATGSFLEDGKVLLRYSFDDSAPSVQSVEMIQLAATTSSGAVAVSCGETVVLASSVSHRSEGEGSGMPGLARIPGIGYAAGTGSDRVTTGSFVVTMEAQCVALV